VLDLAHHGGFHREKGADDKNAAGPAVLDRRYI